MTRFMRRGVAKFRFATAIADISSVTKSELNAALDMTAGVADLSGWQLENSQINVPDMASTFDKNIPGTDAASDSSITFYDDDGEGDTPDFDVDATLPKGTTGFVLIEPMGHKAGQPLAVFPVRVKSKSREYAAGNEPARTMVAFSIYEEPELEGVVPSLT